MVNTDDFIKRLEIILDYYSLSASVFADRMGVQRSGLSHLLSGRNKPSLDFVMKITENFPEVSLYWLLNGTGSFPQKEAESYTTPVSPPAPLKNETLPLDLFSAEEPPAVMPDLSANENKGNQQQPGNKAIDRIVIFYADGSFKSYTGK
jgi:transcriptional regulator with XRE-family HTH domain